MDTPQDRIFTPFPDPWLPEKQVTFAQFVQKLRQPGSSGFLIHGGPGSGKSDLLRYLNREFEEIPGTLIIGPVNMAPYREQAHPHSVLHDLADRIADSVAQVIPGVSSAARESGQVSTVSLLRDIGQSLTRLNDNGVGRTILLLDDFDAIHLGAAISLANRLRELYDEHKRYFTFVLVAESDLEELKNAEHVYSPLKNVTTSYLLCDLTRQQVTQHARDFAQEHELALTDEDLELLWERTEGYPALVNGILRKIRDERRNTAVSSQPSHYSVRDAVTFYLRHYREIEPFRTAVRTIEELNNMNMREYNPVSVLDKLCQGSVPQLTDRGARMLLAMGILGWRGRSGREYLTWRNPFVKAFWESETPGQRLIANWLARPFSFRESQISAQGSVAVSLFMDMAPWLKAPEGLSFDEQRGTDAWREGLRDLPKDLPDGPFQLWGEQKRLTNIGFDLNLFRERTVHESFMPTYEARAQEIQLNWPVQLARFGDVLSPKARQQAENILEQEWRRWSRVRLQLTRDGAVHVILIRDVANPLPLMQILDELLGLDQELDGGELVELSVQWELATAVIGAFMRQIGHESQQDNTILDIPVLNLVWKGPKSKPKTGEVYPLRDRYVIYMLRKLCNCRWDGLPSPDERDIISVKNLQALSQEEQSIQDHQAYNYGRELACLLEGVMIEREKDSVGHFPALKPREVRKLLEDDLSSWENELCLASLDNALLVYQAHHKIGHDEDGPNEAAKRQPESADSVCQVCNDWEERVIGNLHFPKRAVPYEDYWRCLTLGLQYIIELRWSAQWIARQTTNDLERLAGLMEKKVGKRPSGKIQHLSSYLALTTRLLAHLRDASIPMFMSSADYAAQKYQKMIEISGLLETIQSAEKNIEAINAFMYHHEEQETQSKVNKLGMVLAVIAAIIALPSMWIDFGSTNANESSMWAYLSQWPLVHHLLEKLGLTVSSGALVSLLIVTALILVSLILIFWPRRKRS